MAQALKAWIEIRRGAPISAPAFVEETFFAQCKVDLDRLPVKNSDSVQGTAN